MDPVPGTHLLRVYCYAADLVEQHADTLLFTEYADTFLIQPEQPGFGAADSRTS
jgi:hypothetical protein